MRFFFAVLSVSTKTESPAYAPASSSKMFPGFRFAAERHDSLERLAKKLTPSRRKVRACEPLSSVLCLLFSVLLLRAADAPITHAELVRRTQELYDSLVTGDKTPWKKYFADACTFSDEHGRTFDKTNLVVEIAPCPKGYSGAIKIDNVISRIIGDTAVLSYDLNETTFGQELHARYHVTDTWLRRNNDWQILASQAHRYYEDPHARDP